MKLLEEILLLLPSFECLEKILHSSLGEQLIARDFYKIVDEARRKMNLDDGFTDDTYIRLAALKDRLWEIINTGHFSQVDIYYRQLFTLIAIQKTTLRFIKAERDVSNMEKIIEKSIWDLDNGLLIGSPLNDPKHSHLASDYLNVLQRYSNQGDLNDISFNNSNEQDVRKSSDTKTSLSDVTIVSNPSIQFFKENHFDPGIPIILTDCMSQWPASTKWQQPSYLLHVAGHRIVPIEIGKNYTADNWSQDLVKFKDFFRRQFLSDSNEATTSHHVEYLAQHNLFDQIPELRADIIIPEYCCVSNQTEVHSEPDIKAWLGPKDTISPLHYDIKHNLLCQVFGHKQIILAAPKDTENVYPFAGDMLGNTSQIDAGHLDFDKFPLTKNVKFFTITLYKGEILYIPPKWWHYVRSLSKSFSISFWWE